MRILIGNHIDPSIQARGDMRAWTQRLFRSARPGDLLVLCCAPDAELADYALAHTGARREDLTVLAVPPGVWGEKLLDPSCLTAPAFLDRVRAALGPSGADAVEEVFALWAVGRRGAVRRLGERGRPNLGAAFFAQGGVLRNGGQLPALPDAIPPPWRTSGDGDSHHDTGGL
ncbi:hypothetical protein GCM10010277_87410 [Streptomyces longisporoflavus]|uniref:preATP grasp domain-containing protein n=1 Tax=Streptomyces longisporoflavus TaxID=28044 RepID=UPI00167C5564|nr:hypothetical protein [Streptomyces longisporoflavus]GGV73595.1 hypothetical protein GCM10010277_87410 [Streptomyces longisporoflavus]